MPRFASPAFGLIAGFGALTASALLPACAEAPTRGAIAGSTMAGSTASSGPALAEHRALYRLTLLSATGSKSPTAARGQVAYSFDGSACAGYSQTFRQVTELQPADGQTRLSDMRSASFEDGEGKTFSFDVKTSIDKAPAETVDGSARRDGKDVLQIKLSKPARQAIDLDQDVLFPTAHLKRIIAAAQDGRSLLQAKVFDGSDNGQKVYDTTTIIGHPVVGPTDDAAAAHVEAMDAMQRWPVVISYFEDGKKDREPAYTLGFEVYANGVSRALRFDYGDFVLAGQMIRLDLLPAGKPCP